MNNKGFTLVELMAVLVLLSIILGLTLSVFKFNFSGAKKKTEEVFVETIKDSMEVYLTSNNARRLNFDTECSIALEKSHGNVKIYKGVYIDKDTGSTRDTNFLDVISSEYHPITQKDLVNPADKEKKCANAENIKITIYRDEDFVYYYSVDKSEFDCLYNLDGEYKSIISNLPEGFSC